MAYSLFYTDINGVALQLHILYKSNICHRQDSFTTRCTLYIRFSDTKCVCQ